jgi:hypothetical protein
VALPEVQNWPPTVDSSPVGSPETLAKAVGKCSEGQQLTAPTMMQKRVWSTTIVADLQPEENVMNDADDRWREPDDDNDKWLTDADRVAISRETNHFNREAARHYYVQKRQLEREGRRHWTDWDDYNLPPRPPLPDLRSAAEKEGRTDLDARKAYQRRWVAEKRRRLAAASGA